MYGKFSYIYPINAPKVAKYSSTMERMGDSLPYTCIIVYTYQNRYQNHFPIQSSIFMGISDDFPI